MTYSFQGSLYGTLHGLLFCQCYYLPIYSYPLIITYIYHLDIITHSMKIHVCNQIIEEMAHSTVEPFEWAVVTLVLLSL